MLNITQILGISSVLAIGIFAIMVAYNSIASDLDYGKIGFDLLSGLLLLLVGSVLIILSLILTFKFLI